jgi:hypothetical protein
MAMRKQYTIRHASESEECDAAAERCAVLVEDPQGGIPHEEKGLKVQKGKAKRTIR